MGYTKLFSKRSRQDLENYNVNIYALICPKSNEIKYVGKTHYTLIFRLSKHLLLKSGNSRKRIWIDDLAKENLKPSIKLLQISNRLNWKTDEKKWILFYGKEKLLNDIAGGGGMVKGVNNYLNEFEKYLLDTYSKTTTTNYKCYVSKFLKHFNRITRSPIDINSCQIRNYLLLIKDLNTRKVSHSALSLFYKQIIKQPNKLKFIKYEYKNMV